MGTDVDNTTPNERQPFLNTVRENEDQKQIALNDIKGSASEATPTKVPSTSLTSSTAVSLTSCTSVFFYHNDISPSATTIDLKY